MRFHASAARLWPPFAFAVSLAACGSCARPEPSATQLARPQPQELRADKIATPAPAARAPEPAAPSPSPQPSLQPQPVAEPNAKAVALDDVQFPPAIGLQRPAQPNIAREVEVASLSQFASAARRSGTRIVVERPLIGQAVITACDIEVVMREGAEIDRLRIEHGQKRVRLRGGRYREILLAHPAQFTPVQAPRPDWIIEDVTIDGVHIESPGSAIEAYGHRIAVLNSDIKAERYSLWSGPVLGIGSQDILIANNRMSSAGPESTLRLVDVVRSATVDNVLRNNVKHTFRVHGRSDLAYAARNVFINTGVMFGTMPNDQIGEVWFENNTFYHRENDLFHPGPGRVARLHAAGNKAHTANRRCFCCGQAPAGWQLDKNELLPYREPPP
jgi:hypothetical protein